MLNIFSLVVGLIETNCYICWNEKNDCIVIDPGGDGETILSFLEKNNLRLLYIINTHGHGDHIAANKFLKEKTEAVICIHKDDANMLTNPNANLSGWYETPIIGPAADRILADGDIIELGEEKFTVIATPGHTPGGICLLTVGANGHSSLLFSGDTLFCDGIGRTDLPGSSMEAMTVSLKRIAKFDVKCKVYPGHGPETTLEHELKNNPYLQ